jgi:hypothetical protein
MPRNIRMPNGVVISNVPDGVSKQEFQDKYIANFGQEKWQELVAAPVAEQMPAGIAEPAPEVAPPQPTGMTADEQMVARDTLAVQPATDPSLSQFEDDPAGAQQEQGKLQRRLIDLGIRKPEDYHLPEEEYDRITQDRLQASMAARQAPAMEGAPPVESGGGWGDEVEDDRQRGWWKLFKETWKQLPAQIGSGARMKSAATDRMAAENTTIGGLYLESLQEQYVSGEVSEGASRMAEDAASKHGMEPEQYAEYVAGQIDAATAEEFASMEDYQAAREQIEAVKPQSATEGGWIPHISSMIIENTPQLSYIIAGVATGNPALTMSLFGTDVYARTFAQARSEGRDVGGAAQDAFASTVIEAATEGVPVYKIAKLMRAGNKGKAMKLLSGVGTEATQELLAEGGQILYDYGVLEKEMTWGEAFSRMRDAGVVGGVLGSVVSAPAAVFGDDKMADANTAVNDAKKKLQSVIARVQNPNEAISAAEVNEAKDAYKSALTGKRKLVEERLEAKKEKKAAKEKKSEVKAVKKMAPVERTRHDKQKKQAESDQSVTGEVTPEDVQSVETLEKIGGGTITAKDSDALKEVMDQGYVKVAKSGALLVLPAGKRRIKAVRDTIESNATAKPEVVEPVVEPVKTKQPAETPKVEATVDATPKEQPKVETDTQIGDVDTQIGNALRGKRIDDEWTAFSPEAGSLNIPRDQMPQIKAKHRGALTNFLKARGIEGTEAEVPASSLKTTQVEFSEAKVDKAKSFTDSNRAILVSSDGYVLDGHHQWLAQADKGEGIRVIKLDAPMSRLIEEAKAFPSSEASVVPTSSEPASERQDKTNDRLRDLLDSGMRRFAMETQGQAILDDMQESGTSPASVSDTFWRKTYFSLNAQAQARFQRMMRGLGFKPGDVGSVAADGTQHTLDDWVQVGQFIGEDLGESAEHLEGTERGYVSLMKWANDQSAAAEAEAAKRPRLTEGDKKQKTKATLPEKTPTKKKSKKKKKKTTKKKGATPDVPRSQFSVPRAKQTAPDRQVAVDEFMGEFRDGTESTPLNPDARVLDKKAFIEARPTQGVVYIDFLASIEHGKGHGNKALKYTIDLADKHGVELMLTATSIDTKNFSQEDLVDWYQRNGFRGTKVMIRKPRAGSATSNFREIDSAKDGLGSVSKATIDEMIQKHFAPWFGLTNFQVVESVSELPAMASQEIKRFGLKVMGLFAESDVDGSPTIYIVSENQWSTQSAIQTILHETVGHYGLQALLGPKGYKKMMRTILRDFPSEVAANSGVKTDSLVFAGEVDRMQQAEELVARVAESVVNGHELNKNRMRLWERVVAAINMALVKLGIKKMSQADLGYLVQKAAHYVRTHQQSDISMRSQQVRRMKDAMRAMEFATSEAVGSDFSVLDKSRDSDPELDRFLSKIGHDRGSKLKPFRDWWSTKKGRIKQIFEIEIFDQFAGIKHLEQELDIIDSQESAYVSVRLTAGTDTMIRAALEDGVPLWDKDGVPAIKKGTRGLIDILAPVGQNAEMLKMFEAFIVARRAKHLLEENREKLLSMEEIAAVRNYVRKNKLEALFNQTAQEMAEYKKGVLDFAQDAGLIDKDSRALWERADHVPFYRVLADKNTAGPFAHAKMGQLGKVIHRLKGGTDVLKNPLESIVQNIAMLIEASVKNKAMADVVRNFEGTGAITKAPQAVISSALIPLGQVRTMLDEAGVSLDAVGQDLLTGMAKLMSMQPPQGDNVFSVQENGKKRYYYAHDAGLMRGMSNINPNQWTFLMKALRFPKRVITRAITLTPDFILKNWFRDMLHSYVLGRHGTVVPIYDSLKGWGKAIAQDETFKDIMSGGGMFDSGYVNASDPHAQHIAIRRKVLSEGRGNILDTPEKLMNFYMRLANGAENAHRIIVYQKALEKTGSRKAALFEARDIMDFAVRGANPAIRFLTETVPFWGARVQGLQRTGKGFTEHPIQTTLKAIPIVFASVALYAINRDDDRYKALSGYEKRLYYHFFDVFEQGDTWRLPKPFEIGAMFSSVPEVLSEYILSKEPDRGKQMGESIGWIVREMLSLSPDVQLIHPMYELDKNWNDFTDSPIVSYWEQQLPPEDRWSHTTSPSVKWLAQKMPEGAPEWFRSPKQLEYLLKGYFASMMDYALVASDMLYHKANPDEPQPPVRRLDETPFVKAFRREETRKYDKYIGELYEVLSEAEKIHNGIQRNRKMGTDEGQARAKKLQEENLPLLYARAAMKPASKALSKINDGIQRIYRHPTMTPEEKKERIDELLEKRSEIAQKVYGFRPGGTENKFEGGEEVESIMELIQRISGKPKQEQVDDLISSNLPHTAILIHDINIKPEKLRQAAT